MVDESTTHSVLDPTKPLRIIRSHRAPSRYRRTVQRSIIIVAVIGATATVITTEVTAQPHHESSAIAATTSAPPRVEADNIRAEIEREIPKLIEERERATVTATSRRADRPKPPPVNDIEKVIRFALSQQGDPYVWAASGPNAYDCSGLVLRAFGQVGLRLPHFTGALISKGTRVSRSAMQRGDIVFPAAGHVGIYLGGGKFVHASSSRGQVVVAEVYSFYAARRLM